VARFDLSKDGGCWVLKKRERRNEKTNEIVDKDKILK
jgi:hypothetical protein